MLKILALVFLVGLAAGKPAVNRNECVDMNSSGDNRSVKCPVGFVAIGLCASGRKKNCWGAYTRLKCCPVNGNTRNEAEVNCNDKQTRSGKELKCEGQNNVLTGVCTSGLIPRCGRLTRSKISCCIGLGVRLIESKPCYWSSVKYGEMKICKADTVMVGTCSASTCPGKEKNAIKCCPAKNSPSVNANTPGPMAMAFSNIESEAFDYDGSEVDGLSVKSPIIEDDAEDDAEYVSKENDGDMDAAGLDVDEYFED